MPGCEQILAHMARFGIVRSRFLIWIRRIVSGGSAGLVSRMTMAVAAARSLGRDARVIRTRITGLCVAATDVHPPSEVAKQHGRQQKASR